MRELFHIIIFVVVVYAVISGVGYIAGSEHARISKKTETISQVNSVSKSIYMTRREGEACKELNMNLYVWFRSNGIHPDVQIGKLEGQGHLWLEYEGKIYDATNPKVNGKSAKELDTIYVVDSREVEK